MATLEELTPGASVRGILSDATVSVVNIQWHGADALTLAAFGITATPLELILPRQLARFRGSRKSADLHAMPRSP